MSPLVVPYVELVDVHSLTTEIAQGGFQRCHHVSGGKDLLPSTARLRRPDQILGGDFARNNGFARVAERARNQALAMPVTVCKRSIEEIDTRVARGMEGPQRFSIISAYPVAFSNAPGTEADFAYAEPGGS